MHSEQNIGSLARMTSVTSLKNTLFILLSLAFICFSLLSFFVLQFEDFGKSETEVREHMVQLANFLDSVS